MNIKYFKDTNGNPHEIEEGFEHLLPVGLVQINETEFKAIQAELNTPTASEIILGQIATLEASVTQRRIREATLGKDGGWLANVDVQIADLRKLL